MNNKSANKFTFDTEFRGQSDVVSDAARARQKKTLTAEEIEAIQAEAEARGTLDAQVKAAESVERTVSALISPSRSSSPDSSEVSSSRVPSGT